MSSSNPEANGPSDGVAASVGDIPLHEALALIATEVGDLGRCADNLQEVIGELVERLPTPPARDQQMRLQGVDSLVQRLAGLAQLFRALETDVRGDLRFSADRCSQHEVRAAFARLRGAGSRPDATSTESGDCEFLSAPGD